MFDWKGREENPEEGGMEQKEPWTLLWKELH